MLANSDRKRTKRLHSKTRSGCTTCRARRIKCDEIKPKCSQCVRRNTLCEYVAVKTWIFQPASVSERSIERKPSAPLAPLFPKHLCLSQDNLDYSFYLSNSVPLLTSFSTPPRDAKDNEQLSLFRDGTGRALLGFWPPGFGQLWNQVVAHMIFKEPVIYKLACLYGSRHRSMILDPEAKEAPSELAVKAKTFAMLAAAAEKGQVDVVIAGAMIYFAYERTGTALESPTHSGAMHILHGLEMVKQNSRNDTVQSYFMPVAEQLGDLFKFFQQHQPVTQDVLNAVPRVRLPSKFSSAQEAVHYWFTIARAPPYCDCPAGSTWTPQCQSFQQRLEHMLVFKDLLDTYYKKSTKLLNFEQRREVFKLVTEAGLALSAAGFTIDKVDIQYIQDVRDEFKELHRAKQNG